jgi:osmotically-inducible protein OsmY
MWARDARLASIATRWHGNASGLFARLTAPAAVDVVSDHTRTIQRRESAISERRLMCRWVAMRWFQWWTREATADALEWRVRRALMGEPRLRDVDAPRIRISASGDGAITLAGAVSTRQARGLAELVARKVEGVVTGDDLRTDAELTIQLRSRFDSDARTRGLVKDAVVFQGTAELRGIATYDARLLARNMADAIDGVRGVVNYMQLATSARAGAEPRAA